MANPKVDPDAFPNSKNIRLLPNNYMAEHLYANTCTAMATCGGKGWFLANILYAII